MNHFDITLSLPGHSGKNRLIENSPLLHIGTSKSYPLHILKQFWDRHIQRTIGRRLENLEADLAMTTRRLPKLVAFDLDYTLWGLWIGTHITQPLRRYGNVVNAVLDKNDNTISFYQDVAEILHTLHAANVVIAACSRTHASTLAREALSLLLLQPSARDEHANPTPAIDLFDHLEIYQGSKLAHFRQLHKNTGIPYSEMVFYDDEERNREVESLGVTFCLVPMDGIDDQVFEQGLEEWRKRHLDQAPESADNS